MALPFCFLNSRYLLIMRESREIRLTIGYPWKGNNIKQTEVRGVSGRAYAVLFCQPFKTAVSHLDSKIEFAKNRA